MRGFIATAILLCACKADDKPGPVMPAGTGGHISVTDTYVPPDTSSTSIGADSSTTDTSTGSSESSSSTTGPECTADGEECEGDGTCIAVDSGFACSHGDFGDPCVLPGDCVSTSCFPQPDDVDAPGICTGEACDAVMTECESNGMCVMVDEDTLLCSHGEVGEPCVTDEDCDEMRCQEYAVDGGTVLVCAP